MTVGVIVPAAGAGTRLGADRPKALAEVAGQPLLLHAVRRIRGCAAISAVVVAAPAASVGQVRELLAELDTIVVAGGATRQDSVAAALRALPADVDLVLVHDAARAFVPVTVVDAVVRALQDGADAVLPVLPVADTVKRVDGDRLTTVPRDDLRLAQTPQGFRRSVLEAAHARGGAALSDDTALVEALGVTVRTVPGSAEAFKVTTPFDLLVAEALVSRG
ncbi:MAG: 2-C-methyl-D-erythritol 4-phosphate cytidylyltransferase [Frankiales bacterium]|nr:2-C-methyl-D-erythritol 4-phosphate cytidylyltransferase [Frankiales bacterium]